MVSRLTSALEALPDRKGSPSAEQLEAFSGLGQEGLRRFQEAWQGLEPACRRRFIVNLAEAAQDDAQLDFDGIFRLCLSDPDPEVRVQAIEALWENRDRSLFRPLMDLLHDASPEVRATAAASLSRYVDLLELGELPSPKGEALKAALMGLVKDDKEAVEVRRRALESIAGLEQEDVRELIALAYRAPERQLRVSAIYAMGRNLADSWQPMILAELHSAEPEFRYEAARAAGEMGLEGAVPRLIHLTKDPDRQVQLAAIWSLGQIGGEEAKGTLRACAEGADADRRDAAEEALAEIAFRENPLNPLPNIA
ncbi:MAG: HEAT repeat domain-containing protein [Chloroflexota bacterium]